MMELYKYLNCIPVGEGIKRYKFKNYRTVHFSKITFPEQHQRFVLADVVSADSPNLVLDVVPIFEKRGPGNIVDVVIKHEQTKESLPSYFNDPFWGEFVKYKWDTPQYYRMYTLRDVELSCIEDYYIDRSKVGSFVLNKDNTKRKFDEVRVFCVINPYYMQLKGNKELFEKIKTSDLSFPKYGEGWCPNDRVRQKIQYCYVPIH